MQLDLEKLKENQWESIEPAITLTELLDTEFPEARWVVEQLFETETINMLSAPPNKWKSWVVLLCALCIASGRDLFDKFKTERQGVMIVNEEDNPRLLQERCNMLLEEKEELPIYFHIGEQIKLNEEFTDLLIAEAESKDIKVIIFDSLRSVHNADENSSKEMQEIMDQLKKITRAGITVIFTHHNRKKFRGGKDSNSSGGEESRGSSAINAGIHGHLSLEELKKEGELYLIVYQQKLKAGKKIDPIKVLVKENKETKKFSFTYDSEYQDEEKAFLKAQESIKSIFEETNQGHSVKDFKNMGMTGDGAIRLALKLLEGKKEIYSKERGKLDQQELMLIKTKEGKSNEKVYFKRKNELDEF